jgi:putative Mn2+ efflux pump MntP
MIYESLTFKPVACNFNPENIFVLLVLSLATSIDALAIGCNPLHVSCFHSDSRDNHRLGYFCPFLSGLWIGKKFGHFFEGTVEALGGLVLIALGLKILIQHFFG